MASMQAVIKLTHDEPKSENASTRVSQKRKKGFMITP